MVYLPHRVESSFQITAPDYFIRFLVPEISIYDITTRFIYAYKFIIIILGVIYRFGTALGMNKINPPAIKIGIKRSASYLVKEITAVYIIYHQCILKHIHPFR